METCASRNPLRPRLRNRSHGFESEYRISLVPPLQDAAPKRKPAGVYTFSNFFSPRQCGAAYTYVAIAAIFPQPAGLVQLCLHFNGAQLHRGSVIIELWLARLPVDDPFEAFVLEHHPARLVALELEAVRVRRVGAAVTGCVAV